MDLKQQVIVQFQDLLKNKVLLLQHALDELKESGKNETKSTAGDKHETALAMLQIEQENKRMQLKDAEEMLLRFEKINPANQSARVITGSLVKTNKGFLLLSVAAGKITVNGITIIALSPQSPLGSRLLGLTQGAQVEMNNTEYLVENIS